MNTTHAIAIDTHFFLSAITDGPEGDMARGQIIKAAEGAKQKSLAWCVHIKQIQEIQHKLSQVLAAPDTTDEEKDAATDLFAWLESLEAILRLDKTRGAHQELNVVFGDPINYTIAAEAEELGDYLRRKTAEASGERNDSTFYAFAALEHAVALSGDSHMRELDKAARSIRENSSAKKRKGEKLDNMESLLLEHNPYPVLISTPNKTTSKQRPEKTLSELTGFPG